MFALKAQTMATQLHANQLDKAGKPYVQHLKAVVENLVAPTDEMLAVAWLHDSVEDTNITLDEIRYEFGQEIAEAIDAISKRSNEDYQHYLMRVKQNPLARAVKIADLTHNLDLSRLPIIQEKDLKRQRKYLLAKQFLLS